MSTQKSIKSTYIITEEVHYQNKKYGISEALQHQLILLAEEAQNIKNTKVIDRIIGLINQYPAVPILKNYLSVAYNARGDYQKSVEVNTSMLAQHPEYVYARINQANNYIQNSDFEKVPEILGSALEISQLYPERKVFHIGEVINFLLVVIRYYAATGDLELAEQRCAELKKLNPDYEFIEQAEMYIFLARMQKTSNFFTQGKEKIRAIINNKTMPVTTLVEAPQFNHSEIQHLYEYELDIPRAILKEIIALPRISLIEDLENMLMDAVNRYSYFEEMGWNENTHTFVLHSLFLLTEVHAVESLPKILSFLEYDYDFIDFWIGDHKTTTLWQCIYGLGYTNTEALKQFLLLPGVDTYSKTAVSEALCQMVLHNPEKRNEVLSVYTDVLTYFSNVPEDNNLIDSDFLGLTIGDVIDCNLTELLPLIKILYDKEYVTLGINGDYDAAIKYFSGQAKRDHKREVFDIIGLYDHVINTWYGYQQKDKNKHFYKEPVLTQAISEKIGRNDPCPCGSGKKYKKCCMK